MKARALGDILGLPPKERVPILVDGLELLSEHVTTLRATVTDLFERPDPRAAAIVDAVAIEESGKVLALLDFARAGTKHQLRLRNTVRHFYDHVARGIYAEVAMTRPADYREVKQIAESFRPSLYLDGPNGFDWVFRNQIEAQREERIYVDYVRDDTGGRWVTPQARDDDPIWAPSHVTDLVVAMRHSGLLTEDGIFASAAAWQDTTLVDEFHWQDVRRRNVEILDAVAGAGHQQAELTVDELGLAVESWSFPLFDLDLRKRTVEQDELDEQRRQGEAQFYYDIYGPPDW